METNKQVTEHSLMSMELLTERYKEAEEFIMRLKWYEKIFCSRKVSKFIKSRLIKYNF